MRLLRNLIRIGTVNAVDLERGLCRVETGGNLTDWLHWMTCRAGRARMWWAPSKGEQVLVFALGSELDSGFKSAIDAQDWIVSKVTHNLSNGGFTTALEFEVLLSDVIYDVHDFAL